MAGKRRPKSPPRRDSLKQAQRTGPLAGLFDMVCCINLRRRMDRWASFRQRLPQDWPFRQVIRFPGIDGWLSPKPAWWLVNLPGF